MNKKAFTLVELIVIVTILIILWTIWFVSYSWYLSWVRDTNRESQLKELSNSLSLYALNKPVPLPENNVEVLFSWSIVSYQWILWSDIIEAIWYNEEGIDPKDKSYFNYYVTSDRKYYQLLTFLENRKYVNPLVNFSLKYPHVQWDKLWIFIWDVNWVNSGIPLQNILPSWWNIDLQNTSLSLTSILSNTDILIWDHTVLSGLNEALKVWWRWYSVSSSGTLIFTDLDNL